MLTEEEQTHYKHADHFNTLQHYEKYALALNELNSECMQTIDMREIFDSMEITMYFDAGHTGDEGNRLIAEKMYYVIIMKAVIESKCTGSPFVSHFFSFAFSFEHLFIQRY